MLHEKRAAQRDRLRILCSSYSRSASALSTYLLAPHFHLFQSPQPLTAAIARAATAAAAEHLRYAARPSSASSSGVYRSTSVISGSPDADAGRGFGRPERPVQASGRSGGQVPTLIRVAARSLARRGG